MAQQTTQGSQVTLTPRLSLSTPLFGVLLGVWWGIVTQVMLSQEGVPLSQLFGLIISSDAIRWVYMFGSIALFVVLTQLWQLWERELDKIEYLDRRLMPTRLLIYHGLNYSYPVIAVLACASFVWAITASSSLQPVQVWYGPVILAGWILNDYVDAMHNGDVRAMQLIDFVEGGEGWRK